MTAPSLCCFKALKLGLGDPRASSSSAGWGAAGGRAEALGSVPQGEREPRSAQAQSHEARTSFPLDRPGGLTFFPWAPLPSQTQPRLQHTCIVGTPSLSVARPEGSQKVRRNEEGRLVVSSVCHPVQGVDMARQWQLWDPVPVHVKAPASCTPDCSLHLGLMLL